MSAPARSPRALLLSQRKRERERRIERARRCRRSHARIISPCFLCLFFSLSLPLPPTLAIFFSVSTSSHHLFLGLGGPRFRAWLGLGRSLLGGGRGLCFFLWKRKRERAWVRIQKEQKKPCLLFFSLFFSLSLFPLSRLSKSYSW